MLLFLTVTNERARFTRRMTQDSNCKPGFNVSGGPVLGYDQSKETVSVKDGRAIMQRNRGVYAEVALPH